MDGAARDYSANITDAQRMSATKLLCRPRRYAFVIAATWAGKAANAAVAMELAVVVGATTTATVIHDHGNQAAWGT